MFDMLLNLGSSLMGFLQKPLAQNLIQLTIWVGGAWLAGLLLLPFAFNLLWGVIARNFLSGLLQQNLIVESLPWRTWLKPIALFQIVFAVPCAVAIVIIAVLFTLNASENWYWWIVVSPFILLAITGAIVIYCIIVTPFLIQYVWRWACQELFPNAMASGLVSPNITWGIGFALMFLWFIIELLASLPSIVMKILEILKKMS